MPEALQFEDHLATAQAEGKKTAAAIKKYLKAEFDYSDFDDEQLEIIESATKGSKSKKRKTDGDDKKERKKAKLADQKFSKVSDEMYEVIKLKYAPRKAALKLVWKYITTNNLKDPDNSKNYLADELLEKVYGQSNLGFGDINGGLSHHLENVDPSEIPKAELEKSMKVLTALDKEAEEQDAAKADKAAAKAAKKASK
eukprot:NODE_110_length_18645_cov_0.794403.p14 type:complete len:198 gc:universal NODE_110_length_18645_cov_0.794403:12869-12276(-)